jgi:hypothetical protein
MARKPKGNQEFVQAYIDLVEIVRKTWEKDGYKSGYLDGMDRLMRAYEDRYEVRGILEEIFGDPKDFSIDTEEEVNNAGNS